MGEGIVSWVYKLDNLGFCYLRIKENKIDLSEDVLKGIVFYEG